MARIEDYLKMNYEQLEEAVAKERTKIKRAKTEIALLEKLKLASQKSHQNGEQHHGNEAGQNNGEFHHQ